MVLVVLVVFVVPVVLAVVFVVLVVLFQKKALPLFSHKSEPSKQYVSE